MARPYAAAQAARTAAATAVAESRFSPSQPSAVRSPILLGTTLARNCGMPGQQGGQSIDRDRHLLLGRQRHILLNRASLPPNPRVIPPHLTIWSRTGIGRPRRYVPCLLVDAPPVRTATALGPC